jgi:hypothetical protein
MNFKKYKNNSEKNLIYLGVLALKVAATMNVIPSISLLLSHFQQRSGHGSPQKPMQLCPQGSVFWQASLQGSLLHIIPHGLVHLLCSHPYLQGF